MPNVVNSNVAATQASFNLSKSNDALRKSLNRLSSGNRINSPADDAGGLAVAYKLDSRLSRTEATIQNAQNGLSLLQVQDGALETVGKILDRMASSTMAADITKNSGDIENYSKEFVELQSQIFQIQKQKFNGISLFAVNGSTNLANGMTTESKSVSTGAGGNNSNVTYESYGRTLYTAASGAFLMEVSPLTSLTFSLLLTSELIMLVASSAMVGIYSQYPSEGLLEPSKDLLTCVQKMVRSKIES